MVLRSYALYGYTFLTGKMAHPFDAFYRYECSTGKDLMIIHFYGNNYRECLLRVC